MERFEKYGMGGKGGGKPTLGPSFQFPTLLLTLEI